MQPSAVPSDVRRWLLSADKLPVSLGLCPWFGLCPAPLPRKMLGAESWCAEGEGLVISSSPGAKPEAGAQPQKKSALPARRSRRRTSGGRAQTLHRNAPTKLLKK